MSFIPSNMPAGVTFAQPALPPVGRLGRSRAAFVSVAAAPSQGRTWKPTIPGREEKPVGAPYGPYADTAGAAAGSVRSAPSDGRRHEFGERQAA